MRAAVLAAVVLVSAGLLAGFGTRHNPRTLTFFPPYPQIPEGVPPGTRPTSMERHWFAMLGSPKTFPFSGSGPTRIRIRADRLAESIRRAVQEPGVQIASLKIYSTPKLASWLAPALFLEVSRPAYFLRHQLKPVIPLLTENRSAYYLRVDVLVQGPTPLIDTRAKRVLEADSTQHGGSLYVRPGLISCSPIGEIDGMVTMPPCPSK
jgi:hypothetical protein